MTINDIINNAIKESDGKIPNLTRTIAYATQEAYVKAMNDIYKQVGTGKTDYNRALTKTLNELAKTGVTIKSETSERVERIEVAVRRGLFGSLHQTANDIAKKVGEEIDYNCVIIGHSSTCRPSHNVIDDVVMSKKEFEKYEYLTEEYGCNHVVNYDWREEFEGIDNKKEYGEEHVSYSECKRNYEIQQKMRYLERQVRAKKNAIESGATSNKIKKALQLARIKYRTFCNNNNLKMSYNRVIIPKTGLNNNYNGKLAKVNSYLTKNDIYNTKVKELEKINTTQKYQSLIYYENLISSQKVENAIIVQKNGKIIRCIGDVDGVGIYGNINGAIVTHNHVSEDGIIGGSFSSEDIRFLSNNLNIEELRAIDDKYIYILKPLKKITMLDYNEAYRSAILDDDDYKHCVMNYLKNKGLIYYERREKK